MCTWLFSKQQVEDPFTLLLHSIIGEVAIKEANLVAISLRLSPPSLNWQDSPTPLCVSHLHVAIKVSQIA